MTLWSFLSLGVRCWVELQDQISGRSAALRLLSRNPGRVPGYSDERRTALLPVWPSGTRGSFFFVAESKDCADTDSASRVERECKKKNPDVLIQCYPGFQLPAFLSLHWCILLNTLSLLPLPVIFLTSLSSSPSSSFPSPSLPTVFSIPRSPLINVICSPSLAPVREAGRGVKTLKVCQRLNWTAINSFPAVTTREYQLQAN